jgi:hypothetical protein
MLALRNRLEGGVETGRRGPSGKTFRPALPIVAW